MWSTIFATAAYVDIFSGFNAVDSMLAERMNRLVLNTTVLLGNDFMAMMQR
jgi:hypothetical protein